MSQYGVTKCVAPVKSGVTLMAAVQNVIQYNGGADMDVQRLSMPMHWNEDRPITQRQYALANPVIFVANDQTRLSRILNREIRGCRPGPRGACRHPGPACRLGLRVRVPDGPHEPQAGRQHRD